MLVTSADHRTVARNVVLIKIVQVTEHVLWRNVLTLVQELVEAILTVELRLTDHNVTVFRDMKEILMLAVSLDQSPHNDYQHQNDLTLVIHLHVELTQNAVLGTVLVLVYVILNILEILMLSAVQNVYSMQTVLTTKHVYKRSVRIPVQEYVVRTQNVMFIIIILLANACPVLLGNRYKDVN